MGSELIMGHSEFTAYPAPEPSPFPFHLPPPRPHPKAAMSTADLIRASKLPSAPCTECGGDSNAGYGIIPDDMTFEQYAREKLRPKKCYGCSVKSNETIVRPGWEKAIAESESMRPGPGCTPPIPPFNPGKERF